MTNQDTETEAEEMESLPDKTPISRKELRDAIFTGSKPKSETLVFFGGKIELRQIPMREVMEIQNMSQQEQETAPIPGAKPNAAGSTVQFLIRGAYIPETNFKVFDEADAEVLAEMPFGEDWSRVEQALSRLTGIQVKEEVKN